MKRIVQKKILALSPYYTENGANFTKVLLLNREKVLIEKSVSSSLKSLCGFYHLDLGSSNKTCKEMLGITKSPPVYLNEEILLIAVKTRTPIGKDDGAYSYINVEMIKNIKENRIYFNNGESLEFMGSDKTIEKNIKLARVLKTTMENRFILIKEQDEDYLKDYADIRTDLEIIYQKLKAIEKTLFTL